MSAELERVFSSARLTTTHIRNSLLPETIEMLELLRHWWVKDVIAQHRGGGGRVQRKRKAMQVLGGDHELENTMEWEGGRDGIPN
jgi:hypothetical protein